MLAAANGPFRSLIFSLYFYFHFLGVGGHCCSVIDLFRAVGLSTDMSLDEEEFEFAVKSSAKLFECFSTVSIGGFGS